MGANHQSNTRYSIVYQQHPSPALNRVFRERPFQGAVPEESELLFIGLDANYAPDVEHTAAFPSLLEYHEDGVAFWRRHGVHHPFLLPSYRGDGRRYHLNFARIGFGPMDAHRISFAELLRVPTVGRSALVPADLEGPHLQWLERLLTSGAPRHVFLSAGVVRLMAASRYFPWLDPSARGPGVLPVLHSKGGTQVYLHLHFSNYGKFQVQMEREARAIASLIPQRGSSF